MDLGGTMLREKVHLKDCILYGSIYMPFLE